MVEKVFQEIRVPVKSDVPPQDTRTSQVYAYNVRWKRKLIFLALILLKIHEKLQETS
jgi:hypothetical protein